jgi:hypothetical protein
MWEGDSQRKIHVGLGTGETEKKSPSSLTSRVRGLPWHLLIAHHRLPTGPLNIPRHRSPVYRAAVVPRAARAFEAESPEKVTWTMAAENQ